jgi:CRP-like cAMP-binding protein
MNVTTEFTRNDLLRALPEEQRRRMAPRFERVMLPTGRNLSDAGRQTMHVHFPTTAVVTLHHVLDDCFAAAFAIVGHEGAVGLGAMFSERASTDRAVVMQGGAALRIDKRALKWEFLRSVDLQQLLMQYTWSLMGTVAQTSVCNRHHTLEQRLCRWLLLAQDRLPGDDIDITQEFLSQMLGVRREGVTMAAGRLQEAGLIRHRRGHITLVDRTGLEATACDCYAATRRGTDRLSATITRPKMTNTNDSHVTA